MTKTFGTAFAAVSTDDKRRLQRLLDTWRTNPVAATGGGGGPIFNSQLLNQLYLIVNGGGAGGVTGAGAPVKPLDLNVNRVQ